MDRDDGVIKNFIEQISFLNASIDRLARFRSRVCQAVGAGGEESDELIIDKLRDRISATSARSDASSSLTPEQRAEVREIVFDVLDAVDWQKIEKDPRDMSKEVSE